MKESVKFVKLKSGDEFVAKVSSNDTSLSFSNAVRLLPTQEGLGIIPLFPFCKEAVHTIPNSEVLLVLDLEKEIEDGYVSQVEAMAQAKKASESGLILPETAVSRPSIKLK